MQELALPLGTLSTLGALNTLAEDLNSIPIWPQTMVCKVSSRKTIALFWPHLVLHSHAYTHRYIHIHII